MSPIRKSDCQGAGIRCEMAGEPTTVVICHCTECQRQSGSASGLTMVFANYQLTLKGGELKTFTQRSAGEKQMHGHFFALSALRAPIMRKVSLKTSKDGKPR